MAEEHEDRYELEIRDNETVVTLVLMKTELQRKTADELQEIADMIRPPAFAKADDPLRDIHAQFEAAVRRKRQEEHRDAYTAGKAWIAAFGAPKPRSREQQLRDALRERREAGNRKLRERKGR